MESSLCTSHSHLFIVRHFIFCVLSFLFRPCLLSFHFWIILYYIENNVKCITTFYAMKKTRQRGEREGATVFICTTISTSIHEYARMIFVITTISEDRKICPHINCDTTFFPFFVFFFSFTFCCLCVCYRANNFAIPLHVPL